ncbi:MAG: PDZ domain-containing protein [Gemmataceae bacterium]
MRQGARAGFAGRKRNPSTPRGRLIALSVLTSLCVAPSQGVCQELTPRAIAAVRLKADPAVACVFISRSPIYQRLGQAPADAARGKLGRFAPRDLDRWPGLSRAERELLRERLDLGDPRHVPETSCGAVVLDEKGLLLTNYHDIRGAAKLFVRLSDGAGSYADIHAADPRSDLAILRLLDVDKPLTPLRLGSSGPLKRGQTLIGLSAPFAPGPRAAKASMALATVDGWRRRMLNVHADEDNGKWLHQFGSLLHLEAPARFGPSGTALLDEAGLLVGLVTAGPGIVGDPSGAFAVPMDARFRPIVETLLRGEEVEYGFLGIGLSEHAFGKGVMVKDVYGGSPAEAAKLQDGERIVAVDGEKVDNNDDLFFLLGGRLAGAEVKLRVTRPGLAARSVEVTLAKLWTAPAAIVSSLGKRPFRRGLRVDDASILVQQLARWLSIPRGVVITDVEPGSAADGAMLKVGDVVTRVGAEAVATPAEFYRAIDAAKGPVELTLYDAARGAPGPKVTLKE